MGNQSSKERPQSPHQRTASASTAGGSSLHQHISTPAPPDQNTERSTGSRRRSSRHEIGLFSLGVRQDFDPASPESRRETKPERDARKLEKERAQRAVDRERSIREENVDGGFLVTLGTYTGTEDFSKPTVRRLQIERRLAPFWKGLQDHEDNWKDNQLIAAAKDLPIPDPEENTVHPRSVGELQQSPLCAETTPDSSHSNIVSQNIPIPTQTDSPFNNTPNLSPSHPAFSSSFSNANVTSISSSPSEQATHKNPLFRGRAKTLASLASLSRHNTQQELMPQEKQLPRDPYYNGVPLEAVLYKNAIECPICFLYYPPYLNQTRCCDQPICSECFVQIKRPDPHPPEHADSSAPSATLVPVNAPQAPPDTEYQLVSEPATCPFCKQAEFGVTYEPPPFRRGLAYPNTSHNFKSAMSSASSIGSQGQLGHSRRRNLSISADAPNVITTDKVRPDWSKKLSDARAQALRRAAAATALHNAAYVINISDGSDARSPFGRRRRTLFSAPEDGPPAFDPVASLLAAASQEQTLQHRQEGQADHVPGRVSSRRRIEDLEEMMMMEAIRQSIQTEEDRKRKDEKDAAKQAKKDEKQKQKDGKKGWSLMSHALNGEAGESSSTAPDKGKAPSRSEEPEVSAGISTLAPVLALQPTLAPITPASLLFTNTPSGQSTPSPALPVREPPPVPISLSRSNSNASSLNEPHINTPSPFTFGPNGSGISIDGGSFHSETPPGSSGGAAAGNGQEQVFGFRSLDEVIGDDPSPGSATRNAAHTTNESATDGLTSNTTPDRESTSPNKTVATRVDETQRDQTAGGQTAL